MKPEDALIKARFYCAQQERCRFDVKRKLRDWKVDERHFEQIIEGLEKDEFLSEQRFARLFVRSKINQNKWGRMKIRAELAKRQIPQELIDDVLNETDEGVLMENLGQLAEKKLKELERKEAEHKYEKLKAFLYSRGYKAELIYKYLNDQKSNTK